MYTMSYVICKITHKIIKISFEPQNKMANKVVFICHFTGVLNLPNI